MNREKAQRANLMFAAAATTALATATVASTACQKEGTLTGPIAEAYDLDFEQIRAYRVGRELVIAYEQPFRAEHRTLVGPMMNQPVRLVLNSARVAMASGEPMNVEMSDSYYPAILLERYVLESVPGEGMIQGPPFPDIANIEVFFSQYTEVPGEPLAGEFTCVFENQELLVGDFRTVLSEP